MVTLGQLCIKSGGKVYSKNASPFMFVVDILFGDKQSYDKVKNSGIINQEKVAALYNKPAKDIYGIYFVDPAMSIKVSFYRTTASGAPGDTDTYGAQQHVPLLNLQIP